MPGRSFGTDTGRPGLGRGHAAAAPPDLILLDLNLPRKDGQELLEEIKADLALRHIAVVVLTSSQAEAGYPARARPACELLHDRPEITGGYS